MKTIFEEVGQKINTYLKANKMSQQEFADALHISKQVMSKIINGQKAINIEELKKIATIMNMSADELITQEIQTSVIEDPILFMMEKTSDAKIRQHLQYLDFVMDEMIELDNMSRAVHGESQ